MAAALLAAGSLVALPGAADAARPASAVRVAIVDSGIVATHPEFTPGQVVGWKDFVGASLTPYDDLGHGTAVASRAAGATLGAFPGASLLVAKVLDASDRASWGDVANAIKWAADNAADVINVSIWSQIPNPTGHALTIARAVDYATAKGSLVVWIAGNGTVPPSSMLAGSASPAALVVGAATSAGAPAWFSDIDPEVLATGVAVPIATKTGGYTLGDGTSFAAPWAAGVAARMIAEGAPRDPDWLKWVILHSATDQVYPYPLEGYGFLSGAAVQRAVDVARGQRAVPGVDIRDGSHVASQAVRAGQSGSAPVGTLPVR